MAETFPKLIRGKCPSAAFRHLENGGNVLWENPRLASKIDFSRLSRFFEDLGIKGHALFGTSGSSGDPKLALLSFNALLASASMVNESCHCLDSDVILGSLPPFHVGGFGLQARAAVAGAKWVEWKARWHPEEFVGVLTSSKATICSLVPTQVFDLVQARLPAPSTLRVVWVGGGALSTTLRDEAIHLGWPVWQTYGMTETSSQVATDFGNERLRILPGWGHRVDENDRLWLKGDALFSGYVRSVNGLEFELDSKFDGDGWFQTDDRVRLDANGALSVQGRAGEQVKILGELVDLAAVKRMLTTQLGIPDSHAFLRAEPDPRRGNRLILFVSSHQILTSLAALNRELAPFERVDEIVTVPQIPVGPMGKVDWPTLRCMWRKHGGETVKTV